MYPLNTNPPPKWTPPQDDEEEDVYDPDPWNRLVALEQKYNLFKAQQMQQGVHIQEIWFGWQELKEDFVKVQGLMGGLVTQVSDHTCGLIHNIMARVEVVENGMQQIQSTPPPNVNPMENPEFIVRCNNFQNQLDAFKRDLADCPELKKKFLKLQSHVEPYQKEIEYLRGEFIKQERLDTLARERVDRIAGEVNGLLAQIQSYEGRIDGIFGMVNGQLQGIWQVQEQIFMDLSQLKKRG